MEKQLSIKLTEYVFYTEGKKQSYIVMENVVQQKLA